MRWIKMAELKVDKVGHGDRPRRWIWWVKVVEQKMDEVGYDAGTRRWMRRVKMIEIEGL